VPFTLEQLQTLDLDVATEFLLIAAVLLELKARRLLPDLLFDRVARRALGI